MQFGCPACAATISANFAKPGRFTPKCPKCGTPFVVQIRVGLALEPTLAAGAERKRSGPTGVPAPRPPAPADIDATLPTALEAATIDTPLDGTFVAKTAPDAADAADADATFASQPREEPDAGAATRAEATADYDPAPKKPKARAAAAPEMPAELGGYEILKTLGRGGMGAVYLARQVSLDRAVALKVMNDVWADDPVFIARFVREAYAAAQLTHHNVVQIYDIGQDAGTNFFSMEFVEGKSLGDVLKKAGRVPAPEAVGYIVQAARGLKFAHDRGMVHRDIKPDNLMLNAEGVVKVADLGLVKTRGMTAGDDAPPPAAAAGGPGSMLKAMPDVTRVGTAMGSPSYMAPEQCRDASGVDLRADIYSLGCALYALLGGRAPFTGATAVEIIAQHLNDPPPPLARVLPGAPRELADIVDKTLRKDPADRYQTMDELIGALKAWQSGNAGGPPRPTEEQLAAFEYLLGRLTVGKAAKFERLSARLVPVLGLAAALGAVAFSPVIAGGLLVGTAAALLGVFVCGGLFGGSHVFAKARESAFGARALDWLTPAAAGVAFFAALYFAGLLWVGSVAMLAGAGVGLAHGFLFAKPARDHRLDLKEEFEKITKRLRLAGMDEDAVRLFVVGSAGDRWERVYELLYGFPAKIAARGTYAEAVGARPKYAAWREPIVAAFDGWLEGRKQARVKALLRKMEAARLRAEGLGAAEAHARAADAAEAIVEQAVEIKAANADAKRAVNVRRMMTAYERGKIDAPPRKRKNPLARLLKLAFDPRWRLLVGAALLIVGLMGFKAGTAAGRSVAGMIAAPETAAPPAWLPDEAKPFFTGVNAIAAGALLLLSALASRGLTTGLMVVGAAVALAGHRVGLPIPTVDAIPDAPPLQPSHLAAAAGLAMGLAAMVLLRRRGR